MYAYHIVTDRPLRVGKQLIFDEARHNGVYQRVCEKINIVKDIYSNPVKYSAEIKVVKMIKEINANIIKSIEGD